MNTVHRYVILFDKLT